MDFVAKTSAGETFEIPFNLPNGVTAKDLNEKMVRGLITENEHPHPLLLTSIILIIIMLIYFLYITMIKRDFSGEWYSDGYMATVTHCRWTDRLVIDIGQDQFDGQVIGNAIYMISADSNDILKGVYYDKKIYWTFGSGALGNVWQRAVKA